MGSIMMYRYRKFERLHNEIKLEYSIPISIIVPVYNENETALQTIDNLIIHEYSPFELVVVDDGSVDDTKQLIIEKYQLTLDIERPIRYQVPCQEIKEIYSGKVNGIPITLVHKKNGGSKADANNAGINMANYPYFVDMDGDELLQRDALKYASRALLENSYTIGVGGNIKISNNVTFGQSMPKAFKYGSNIIPDIQTLEYGRAFVGSRIFQDLTNSNLIISGGYGLFEKQAVINVGGYDPKSLGEDMELTMKLHEFYLSSKQKYRLRYVPDSVCWTQAPATLKDVKRQRERWHCGLMQTMWKFRKMMFNPRYGVIGLFTLPFMLFYELFCSVFIIFGWLILALSAYLNIINYQFAIIAFSLYILLGIMMTISSFIDKNFMKSDHYTIKDLIYFLALALLDALAFRPYLFIIQFGAFFKFKKISEKWESPARIKVSEE